MMQRRPQIEPDLQPCTDYRDDQMVQLVPVYAILHDDFETKPEITTRGEELIENIFDIVNGFLY